MGAHIREMRDDFEACLREVLDELALRVSRGETGVAAALELKGFECQARFFRSMMGAANILEEDVREALAAAESRQRGLYGELRALVDQLSDRGVRAEIVPPDRCLADPYWDTGLITGCNVEVEGAHLYASPLLPAATTCWGALVQEPVAADVLHASESSVILLPSGQALEGRSLAALQELLGAPRDVRDEFPGAYAAVLGGGFLLLDTAERYSDVELRELKEGHRVHAVVKVNSGSFTGFIYTGEEDRLPKILRTVFFEWHGNWRRYNE